MQDSLSLALICLMGLAIFTAGLSVYWRCFVAPICAKDLDDLCRLIHKRKMDGAHVAIHVHHEEKNFRNRFFVRLNVTKTDARTLFADIPVDERVKSNSATFNAGRNERLRIKSWITAEDAMHRLVREFNALTVYCYEEDGRVKKDWYAVRTAAESIGLVQETCHA